MHPMPRLALFVLASLPLSVSADGAQADRYFAVRSLQGDTEAPEFVIRITETARAQVFANALRDGRPMRLVARHVQRPALWNAAWPFYTERNRLVPLDKLVAHCPSQPASEQARRVHDAVNLHGSAWCPAVVVVREIKRRSAA